MKTLHIKKGDTVQVISGNSKGQKGKVLEVSPSEGKAIVEGVNMVSKHVKPRSAQQQGGIVKTPGPEVDLGLSVNWAGWNVGASSPEEYGGYYAWGETEEKSDYSVETYKYWVDSNGDGNWYYDEFTNIGTNISGTQYDVARQKWGGSWRMPTGAEIDELTSKCTWTWYQYKGVWGRKFTGPNGNSIFLPAAGGRYDTSLYNDGSYGNYWGATLSESFCSVRGLNFGDGYYGGSYGGSSYYDRHYGHSVRPVK